MSVPAEQLDDMVAVVTGAASGIGAALVAALSAGGASVLAVDLDDEGLDAVEAQTGCATHRADVATRAGNDAMVARAIEGFGRIDLGFLNAGVLDRPIEDHDEPYGPTDLDLERFRLVRAVNLDGVVYGTIALATAMEDRGGGAVVATASTAGLTPWAPTPMYTATKHAVVGWVRAIGPVFAARGVRVNAICPAGVATPLIGRTAADAEVARHLLAPATVAEAMIATALGGEVGQVVTVVPGRDPVAMPHQFNDVAGFPRTPASRHGPEGPGPILSSEPL